MEEGRKDGHDACVCARAPFCLFVCLNALLSTRRPDDAFDDSRMPPVLRVPSDGRLGGMGNVALWPG